MIGDFEPEAGIVLGSGLGGFADRIDTLFSLSYADIPGFPRSTVAGHDGRLIFGRVGTANVVAMKGRFHYYEGYTTAEVVLPVRVMRLLGVRRLFLSNAAGAVSPALRTGDLMAIDNHINFIPNPLIGPNPDELGVRFPDMKHPYSARLIAEAERIMPGIKRGCYVAVTGPSYETSAEVRFFRMIGGDAVGMSTVPEVIAGVHAGMEVFALSVITNDTAQENLSHEEVLQAGVAAGERMGELFEKLIVRG